MIKSDKSRVHLYFLAAITIAAFWLRLAHLGEPSLWWDEFITLGVAKLDLWRLIHVLSAVGASDIGAELFPPLYHALVKIPLAFGAGDALLRLPSVIFGTLTVPALYFLGKTLFSRNTGLFAAFFCAVSAYHMNYSRELRPYSLYFLLAVLSMAFFVRAFAGNRGRDWAAYVLCCAAMFYTAYTATTIVAAQGIYAAGVVGWGLFRKEYDLNKALQKTVPFFLALCAIGLSYLPWIGAYRTVFSMLRDPSASPSIPLDFIVSSLQEFSSYAFVAPDKPWVLFTLAALSGAVLAFVRKKRRQLFLLLAWGFFPVAAFLLAKTALTLSSRYFFNIFFCMLLASAFAVDEIVRKAFAALRAPGDAARFPGVAAGLFLCLALSLYNLRSLPDFYRREPSYNKEIAQRLLWEKNNVGYLGFSSNRNQKLIAGWYVKDGYKRLSGFTGRGYKRAYILGPGDWKPAQNELRSRFLWRILDVSVHEAGLVNRAPLLVFPGPDGRYDYRDDYRTFDFYADAYKADNMAPDVMTNALAHYDYDKPASALYKFVLPKGLSAKNARLVLTFKMSLIPGVIPDSDIGVFAGAREEAPEKLDAVSYQSYLDKDGRLPPPNVEKKYFLERAYDLPRAFADGDALYVRLDYAPVVNNGVIELESFHFTADAAGSPGQPGQPGQAMAVLANVAENTDIVPFTPGRPLIGSSALYAFRLTDAGAAPSGVALGSVRDHEAYLAAHPGQEPVFVITDASGAPAVALYDPALTRPWLSLIPDAPQPYRLDRDALTVRAVKLTGALSRPDIAFGGAILPAPVSAPPESSVLLNYGGEGLLLYAPTFSSDASAFAALPIRGNLRRNEGEDCVSCATDSPCYAVVPINSDYPMKSLRIAAYPRVMSDLSRQNNLRTSYSLDGKTFIPLDKLESSGSMLWEGLMVRRLHLVSFDEPVHQVFVRFDLSGQGAQLWSRDHDRMRIEAALDVSGVPAPVISGPDVTAVLRGAASPLEAILFSEPQGLREDLKDAY